MKPCIFKTVKDREAPLPEPGMHIPDGASTAEALHLTTHLAIGAHQDDLELFAYHGIATCYKQPKKWVGGITVTDGAGCVKTGKYADYNEEQIKTARHREQNQAADIGAYSFQYQLNHSSAGVKEFQSSRKLVTKLVEILNNCRPEVLYLHNPVDKHPTHLAVLQRCIEAFRTLPIEKRPPCVWGCEVWRDLDWLCDEDKILLPVDQYPDLAQKLIEVFDSQVAGGKDYVRATLGRRYANATYRSTHQADPGPAFTYAIDLNPLLQDDELTLQDFLFRHLDRFREDVLTALDSIKVKPE
jgi:LmbE family N-acetylglucosaminyl deacetylase